MSHISRIKTSMVQQCYLEKALADLDVEFQTGGVKIRGYGSERTSVEISVKVGRSRQVGFRKNGNTYELVGDWYAIRKFNKKTFLAEVTRRYAYHATMDKLRQQAFDLVTEQVDDKGRIHLVLRRMG